MPIHTRSGAVYGIEGDIVNVTVTAKEEVINIPAPLSNTNMTLTVEDDAITTDTDTYYGTETSETYVECHDDEETYYPSDDTETVADALTVNQRWQALKAKIAEDGDDSASIENIREAAHILNSMFRSRRMTTTQQEEGDIPTDNATTTHRYMLRTNVVRDYKNFYGEGEGHEVVDGIDDDDEDDETFSIGSITTVAEDDSDCDSGSCADNTDVDAGDDADDDSHVDDDADDELYNDDDGEEQDETEQEHYNNQLNKRLLSREIKRQIIYDTGVFRKYLKQYADSKDTHGKRMRILHILQYFIRHPLTLVQCQRIRKVIRDKVTEFSAYISVYNYRKKLRSSTDMLARVAGDCVIACAGAGAGTGTGTGTGAGAGGNTINIEQQLRKYEKQDKLYHAIGKACATLKQIITDIEMSETDESYGRSMRRCVVGR